MPRGFSLPRVALGDDPACHSVRVRREPVSAKVRSCCEPVFTEGVSRHLFVCREPVV